MSLNMTEINNLHFEVECIDDLAQRVHRMALEKGWWDTDSDDFAGKMILIHTEISEAFEEYRNGHRLDRIRYEGPDDKPEGVAVELADAIIRILDLCKKMDIPIAEALGKKVLYNDTRPYRHGGKKV